MCGVITNCSYKVIQLYTKMAMSEIYKDLNIFTIIYRHLSTRGNMIYQASGNILGRRGSNTIRGPNLSTLLVSYGNYVELLPLLYQDLVALTSVKEHYIFTKLTHSFP